MKCELFLDFVSACGWLVAGGWVLVCVFVSPSLCSSSNEKHGNFAFFFLMNLYIYSYLLDFIVDKCIPIQRYNKTYQSLYMILFHSFSFFFFLIWLLSCILCITLIAPTFSQIDYFFYRLSLLLTPAPSPIIHNKAIREDTSYSPTSAAPLVPHRTQSV